MPGMGGAPKTQNVTQTTNTTPWIGAQPALNAALGGAITQYNNGMPAYYPGQTVAPMSDQTVTGLNAIAGNAGNATNLANQAWNSATGAMNPDAVPGTDNLSGIADGGASNPFASFFQGQTGTANPFLGAIGAAGGAGPDLSQLMPFLSGGGSNPFMSGIVGAGGAPVTGAGMDTLTQAATGGMMQNPYLDATFHQGADAIRNELDGAFARSGRSSNNGNFAAAYGKSLGDFGTNLYGGAYDADMSRRMGAAGALSGYEQGGADRLLGALGTAAGLGENQFGRQLNAATLATGASNDALTRALQAAGMGADTFNATRGQNLEAGQTGAGLYNTDLSRGIDAYLALAGQQNAQTGQSLTAAGMLPGIYDFSNQGAQDLLGVGSSLEAYQQALINADRQQYDYTANAPRTNVEWLNAIANGAGGLGQSSTQTSQVPYQQGNPFLGALGGATSGASLAGMLGMSGMGANIMSGIGAILPFLSDPAAKRDVCYVGEDDAGNRIYRFRYAWDDEHVVRHGVMADEVDPAFVLTHPSGLAMVDYGGVFA